MKGIPYIVFLIRAAGPIGKAHAEALYRMYWEGGNHEAAMAIRRAIKTPFTDAEKAELLKPNGVEPS